MPGRMLAWAVAAASATLVGFADTPPAGASSHREAPLITQDPLADNTDVYAFRSLENPDLLTIIASWVPLEDPVDDVSFDPHIRYEVLVDTDGDDGEDVVFQFTFSKPDAAGDQKVKVHSRGLRPNINAKGRTDQVIPLPQGGQAFAGRRDDPYFADLGVFDLANASLCSEDPAADGLAGFNVLTTAVEIPITTLGATTFNVWSRSWLRGEQIDRMGNPLVATLMLPEELRPAFRAGEPANDVEEFRQAVVDTLVDTHLVFSDTAQLIADSVLPNYLRLNLAEPAGFPNGRALGDDVTDVMLGLIELPGDCVGANDVPFGTAFPYLAAPHGIPSPGLPTATPTPPAAATPTEPPPPVETPTEPPPPTPTRTEEPTATATPSPTPTEAPTATATPSSCGNGTFDPGEECEPPGTLCTNCDTLGCFSSTCSDTCTCSRF